LPLYAAARPGVESSDGGHHVRAACRLDGAGQRGDTVFMKRLRILHSEAATSFGGQEQYILRMMLAMRERGHHMEAVCQPHAVLTQRLREEGFTVHTTLMDGPYNFVRGVTRIRRILRAGKFDVLNCHSRRDTIL